MSWPARKRIDIAGRRFGRLVAVCWASGLKWAFVCDCGTHKDINAQNVKRGLVESCGCKQRERERLNAEAWTDHGDTGSPEHRVWHAMINRCTNPNTKDAKNYMGRGITVCDRWRWSYANFLADMGRRPSDGHTIDRINNDGNYEPGNCRWATRLEQNRNRRPVERNGASA